MNIRRRSSVFVFYIIACNTAIWRYENKRVNLFWRDEESQPFQRKYASYELLPELATISWIACLLASAEGPVLHSLSPCQSSQVNWPQTLRGNYCTCSWSLSSINGEKMTSCARVYWICHFNSWISYPRLCFIAFQMKFNYPVPSHFQFSGRDGSGTWKKVRDGSGTGIPSDPEHVLRVTEEDQDKISCIWLLMPPYPPPPQIKSSLWRPLVVVMEHYPKKKEVSRLISYVWCDIVQALNLKYIKISGS